MTAENLDFLLHGIFIQIIRTLFIFINIHFGFLEKTYVNKCQQQKNEFGKIIILHYQVMIYMKSKLCNFKKRSYQPKHH